MFGCVCVWCSTDVHTFVWHTHKDMPSVAPHIHTKTYGVCGLTHILGQSVCSRCVCVDVCVCDVVHMSTHLYYITHVRLYYMCVWCSTADCISRVIQSHSPISIPWVSFQRNVAKETSRTRSSNELRDSRIHTPNAQGYTNVHARVRHTSKHMQYVASHIHTKTYGLRPHTNSRCMFLR